MCLTALLPSKMSFCFSPHFLAAPRFMLEGLEAFSTTIAGTMPRWLGGIEWCQLDINDSLKIEEVVNEDSISVLKGKKKAGFRIIKSV